MIIRRIITPLKKKLTDTYYSYFLFYNSIRDRTIHIFQLNKQSRYSIIDSKYIYEIWKARYWLYYADKISGKSVKL